MNNAQYLKQLKQRKIELKLYDNMNHFQKNELLRININISETINEIKQNQKEYHISKIKTGSAFRNIKRTTVHKIQDNKKVFWGSKLLIVENDITEDMIEERVYDLIQ